MYLRDKQRRIEAMQPPPQPQRMVTDNELDDVDAKLLCVLSPAQSEYTSDTMEEDFSTSMQLLEIGLKYLRILRDANKHQGIMAGNLEQEFTEHLDAVEEFTGRFND